MQVIKRDGKHIADFDRECIFNAIKKATFAANKDMEEKDFNSVICNEVTSDVVDLCEDWCKNNVVEKIPVGNVHDFVERSLIKHGYADTAKEYILYREKRNELHNQLDSITDSISGLLNTYAEDNDAKRDNGNVDGDSPMGTMLHIASTVAKNFYLLKRLSRDAVKAYRRGFIHIHDLDFYDLTMTCCQIDCLKLFKNGFNTGHGYLREPNSIGSYTTLAAIAIQSNQNDQHRLVLCR